MDSPTNNKPTQPTSSTPESHESAFSVAGAAQSINPDDPETASPPSHLQINKPQGRFKRLLKSKKFWFLLVLILLAVAVGLWFFQPTRVWIVNTLGQKVPLVVKTTTVAEAGQPSAVLQRVTIKVNGAELQSDERGETRTKAAYGKLAISAEKPGYTSSQTNDYYDFDPFFGLLGGAGNGVEQTIEMQLKSIGLPLKFKAVDWLTGQPITTGEFGAGDVVAEPDETGVVSLKIPPTDAKTVKISAKFDGSYNDQEFELAIQSEPVQEVVFTPAGRDYFVSKHSGQLGVYSSNVDGTDVKELVAPSANQTAAVDVTASPSGKYAVVASTHEGLRDGANRLLQKLYVFNVISNTLKAVDEGLWFDFADWAGDSLVYTTASDAATQRLASVDISSNQKFDIGTAASYGVVRVSLNSVVYQLNHKTGAPGAENNPELRIVLVKGGNDKNIGNKVKAVSQSDVDKIAYQTADNTWHEYNVNAGTVGNISAPASSTRAFLAAASPNGQSRLFVDKVDGKNTIYTKNIADGKETAIYGESGLRGPVRWLNTMIIFRLSDSTQTADYAVPISGGTPKKISDVTNSASPQSDAYFSFY